MLKKVIPAPEWFLKEWEEINRIREELENYLAHEEKEKNRIERLLALDEEDRMKYHTLKDFFDAKTKALWSRVRLENSDKKEILYGRLTFNPETKTISVDRGSWKKGKEQMKKQWKVLEKWLEEVNKNENKDKKL